MQHRASVRSCVIGGAGFIGRSLVKILLDSGRGVVVIDRSERSPKLDPRVEYRQGDYANRAFLEEVLSGVDEVIDLAYASVPKTSFEDPSADLLHNVPPALSLFEVAAGLKLKKVVLLSSGGTVYGQAQTLPITETHPTNPISPYGITKLAVEKYAGLFFVLKKLPVVILRPGNAYGEEQAAFTGQGFIATAIASILEGKSITIFGKHGAVRDYVHVHDIATGILAALDKGKVGECYNLGTGVGTDNKKIMDLLTEHAKKSHHTVTVSYAPKRKFDVAESILDSSKITEDTGWLPSVGLEKGLQKTWNYWVKRHG